MQEPKTEKSTLAQEIVAVLKENAEETPEGYTGAEWIEAAEMLSELKTPIILGIPWCIFDLELDEFGVHKLESQYDHLGRRNDLDEDGNIDPDWIPGPKRRSRNDVLAILAWVPMKRELPDLTLDDVKKLMNDGNIIELTTMVFKFWGVDTEAVAERIAALTAEAEEGETPEKPEAAEPVNFQESSSKGKLKKSP